MYLSHICELAYSPLGLNKTCTNYILYFTMEPTRGVNFQTFEFLKETCLSIDEKNDFLRFFLEAVFIYFVIHVIAFE